MAQVAKRAGTGYAGSLAIALIACVSPAHAGEITDNMPCGALAEVMDSENLERIGQYGYYIFNVMDKMDIDHVQRGETGHRAANV
jgi:hypothetical protein